jgi:hypothetical protein
MSLRLVFAIALVCACGTNSMKVKKGEPQTAREKMLAEEKAHPTDKDDDDGGGTGSGGVGKKWSGWRYQGDRKECFFVVGKKCFKTQNAACQASHCKAPSKCETEGGGPATMKCSKK